MTTKTILSLDCGGSIAAGGFNYQKSVISLIAILNYHKGNLDIYIENRDDVEVILDNHHTFIQIKGEANLNIGKLIRADSQNKSILSKNLNKISEKPITRHKIVTLKSFSKTDLSKLKQELNPLIFDNLYKYSKELKEKIKKTLATQEHQIDNIDTRLDNSYIYFTTFSANLNESLPVLLGQMVQKKILVDNNQGLSAIRELFLEIDQRSEIKASKDNLYNPSKKLTGDFLKTIFITANQNELRMSIFTEITSKPNRNLNTIDKEKIKKEFLKVLSHHRTMKQSFLQKIGCFKIESRQNINILFDDLFDKVAITEPLHVIYAIIIDIITDQLMLDLQGEKSV